MPYKFIKPMSGGEFAAYYEIQSFNKYIPTIAIGVPQNEASPKDNFTLLKILKSARSRYVDFSLVNKIGALIKQHNVKVIVGVHPYLGWLYYLLKKKYGVQIAIRSQNVEAFRFRDLGKPWWPIMRLYEKWVNNIANYVLCITEEDFAQFKKDKCKAKLINLPFGSHALQSPTDRPQQRIALCKQLQIEDDNCILFFNGNLSYVPNVGALNFILDQLNPILLSSSLKYKIIICGGRLAASYNNLEAYKNKNVIYCGFVEDIGAVFKGVDIFLNPIVGGGGIKTKLVDALSFGTQTISSHDGAKGIVENVLGNKLIKVADSNAQATADAIYKTAANKNLLNEAMPKAFYEYYNWHNIAQHCLQEMGIKSN